MIDLIKSVVISNRISCKVKFNYLPGMASNIEQQFWTCIKNQNLVHNEMSFLEIINLIIPNVKINPKHLEAHFLSLPFTNIN